MTAPSDSLERAAARFWAKVDRSDPDGCWLWTGARTELGYGMFRLAGRTHSAARVAWLLSRGQAPAGPVLRTDACNSPSCVRPEHLREPEGRVLDRQLPTRPRRRQSKARPAQPGHVRRRGDRWQVIVYAGPDPATGRRRYLSGTVRDEGQVEQLRARLLRRAELHRRGEHGRTVAELYGRWLEHAGPGMSPSSRSEAARHGRLHIIPALGHLLVAELDGQVLDDWYAGLCEHMKPVSARRVGSSLRSALERATKWGWCDTNPMGRASPPRVRKRKVAPPTVEEVVRLLARAEQEEPAFGLACWLLAVTGARRGEVAALQWRQLDWADSSLLVDHGLLIVGRELQDRGYPKGDEERQRIALDEATMGRLAGVWEARRRHLGGDPPAGSYILSPWPDGRAPYRPDGLTRRWARTRALEGLGHVRLHDLRHHAATALLRAGVDILEVAGRLRHADPATTLRVYGHFRAASDRRSADLLAHLLNRREIPAPPVPNSAGSSP